MITLSGQHGATLDAYLAGSVVDARLELVAKLGGEQLATFQPSAGTVRWDDSRRCGTLDVDVELDAPVLTSRHPLAPLGQTLEASWVWPDVGISVPLGSWLVAESQRIDTGRWRVAASPEGPARLDRARWWKPGKVTLKGKLRSQVTAICSEGRVSWTTAMGFVDAGIIATEAEAGTPLMDTLSDIMTRSGQMIIPQRSGRGIHIGWPASSWREPSWRWSSDSPTIASIEGTPPVRDMPNRVTVYYETETKGKASKASYSEAILAGPRRWGGPYGAVPEVVRLDAPVSQAELKRQAQNILKRRAEQESSLTVTMRADPRIELGDTARVVAAEQGTDCTVRVSAVALDAGTGLATVECTAIYGRINGASIDLLDLR